MNGWRIAIFLVGLLFATPFILLNYWGFQVSVWSHQVGQSAVADAPQNSAGIATLSFGDTAVAVQPASGDAKASAVDVPPMPRSPIAWLQDRGELRRMFSYTEFSAARMVTVDVQVPFQAVLKAGERAPDPLFRPLYVEARAPAIAQSYCAELLATLASACRVHQTSSTYRSRDDVYAVNLGLSYLPAYELGEPAFSAGADMITAQVDLTEGDGGSRAPGFDADQRRDHMGRAKEICGQIRAAYGSCVISRLSLSADAPRGDRATPMRVRASFKTYALETEEETRKFQEFVSGLVVQNL